MKRLLSIHRMVKHLWGWPATLFIFAFMLWMLAVVDPFTKGKVHDLEMQLQQLQIEYDALK